MGIIYIFRNGSVTFRKSSITFCNDPRRFRNVTQRSVMLCYALYRLQLAHAFSDVEVATRSSQMTLERTYCISIQYVYVCSPARPVTL